ncbi:MAG: aminotransferase class I/II-fold pyridoxal phosphate-dependent enzyme, partial [Bacteroidota bacterium]
YSREQLSVYADWCIAHNIHLVVNEIYGLSLLDTSHPDLKADYPEHQAFYSFANTIKEKNSEYLHWWYSLSKDFGVSGFRVGIMYSLNATLRKAFNNLNAPAMVSNYAQWTFEKVLADHDFVASYIKANQRALTENYVLAVTRLRSLKIPYSPARGSLFVWLDFSEFMPENSAAAEHAIWMDLFKQTGVLLTPGDGFGHARRGQFRLVYSYVNKEELGVVMGRMEEFIRIRRTG